MMNHPVPSPSEPPAAAPPRRAPSSAPAIVVALLVFGSFVAYAFLTPATFRTTAEIVLKPTGSGPLVLPSSPDPTLQLRSAAVDQETLEQTARELGLDSAAAAKQRVETDLEVKRSTPETFDFAFRASKPAAAERVADLLARHAAARAVRSLSPTAPDQHVTREAARAKSASELATFIAAHPELTPPGPSVVPVAPKDASETDTAALRAERDQLQSKLARMPEAAPGSDNPFGDSPAASPEAMRLRRRVAEIDQKLRSHQRAEKKPESLPKIAPEVDREWKRLLQAVANPVVTETAAPPPAFTVMLREAALPSAPIEPDRRKIALYGGVTALLAALGVLLLRLLGSRRGETLPATAPMGGDWPRTGSEPPRAGSEPPLLGVAAEPGGEPTRPGSDPPLLAPEASRANMPSRPPSDSPRADGPTLLADQPPPQQKSDPPRPIVAITSTQVLGGTMRTTSSKPPADAARADTRTASMKPSRAAEDAQPPAEPAPGAPTPSPIPATVVGLARMTPVPEAPAAPPRPTPAYSGELGRGPADIPVPKGTLLGMSPVDARALDATLMASGSGAPPAAAASKAPAKATSAAPGAAKAGAAKSGAAGTEPFVHTPSTREPAVARSTLRPPPPDEPKTPDASKTPAEPTTHTGELMLSGNDGDDAGAGHQQSAPAHPPDDSWTGPSRAHRRSMNAARRTTQMLGSPIQPVVRSSRPPPERNHATSTPVPGSPTGTSYSYVSQRPEAPTRGPIDTPPYYQESGAPERDRDTPLPRQRTDAPRQTRVTKHPARAGWAADPSLDFRTRRALSDQVFPLAVEGCFVVGVSAVGESRVHKSRVAAELALALAEPNHPRVLLLEGDFQWPSVHQLMRIEMPMSMGFSQQLRGKSTPKPDAWTVVECTPTLDVLAEGIMRSPGHILSVQFEASIQSLRAYYDFIVIDGPDTKEQVECRALANVIDGIVLVAPAGGSPSIAHSIELFPDKRFSTIVGV
jgi:Mrp family chromosome partitioning ATPase